MEFVRKLSLPAPVSCAAINNLTGDILLCRGQNAVLTTLNGELLCNQNVCNYETDEIFSCAFFEGGEDRENSHEWLANELVFTCHKRGVVNVWKKTTDRLGKWMLALVKRLDHVDEKTEEKRNVEKAIVKVATYANKVVTTDEDGRTVSVPNSRHEYQFLS